eukprot:c39582_g1_i1 orf=18-209(+)
MGTQSACFCKSLVTLTKQNNHTHTSKHSFFLLKNTHTHTHAQKSNVTFQAKELHAAIMIVAEI